jgi:ubiquinone/menaquinone biosynthesis C-methylase UbiE
MAEDVGNQRFESAHYSYKHQQIIRHMFAPITDALIRDARITPGYSVLDVGTGPGKPALTVARSVGKLGTVYGIDPAEEMITAARRASERERIDNVHFEVSSVDTLPFAANTFDAIVSRFAMMFFPSPIKGIEQILRVLKPNAYAAFAVWSFARAIPFTTFYRELWSATSIRHDHRRIPLTPFVLQRPENCKRSSTKPVPWKPQNIYFDSE